MTIRSNVNIAAANSVFEAFEAACERAPEGTFEESKTIRWLIGETCDDFLSQMQGRGINVCNCDGIREVEVMLFDMIHRKNPVSEIDAAIGLGRTLLEYPDAADRVIAGLIRDRDFLASIKEN